ncbi:hypothetical protein PQR71_18035 [Paraburkholderia fungorum]|uniref:hypothetical protein n=1 Tax=Paraburkholderia fungorum TaxID=134537 RepID=UPI0038B9F2B5
MPTTSLPADHLDPSAVEPADDFEDDYRDDMEYDPPIPYDYRNEWAEDAEDWALEKARNLIAIHEGGPDFYENLNASVIERWLFSDNSELEDALKKQQSLDSFRANLAHFCTRMTAAGAYSQILLKEQND